MRFDELPSEVVVMISKHCDPFTLDQLRISNRRNKNIIDTQLDWKPSLDSLSFELVTHNPFLTETIRVTTCTVYGKEEQQNRKYRTSEERVAIIAECLAKVPAVRSLILSGIPIDHGLVAVLQNEVEKLRYLEDMVLENCCISLGKTEMFNLVNNMKLKSMTIIRCRGALWVVDDNLTKSVADFVFEGSATADARHKLGEDSNITIEQLNHKLEAVGEKIHNLKARPTANRPIQMNLWRNPEWRGLRDEIHRLEILRVRIEMKMKETPLPQISTSKQRPRLLSKMVTGRHPGARRASDAPETNARKKAKRTAPARRIGMSCVSAKRDRQGQVAPDVPVQQQPAQDKINNRRTRFGRKYNLSEHKTDKDPQALLRNPQESMPRLMESSEDKSNHEQIN